EALILGERNRGEAFFSEEVTPRLTAQDQLVFLVLSPEAGEKSVRVYSLVLCQLSYVRVSGRQDSNLRHRGSRSNPHFTAGFRNGSGGTRTPSPRRGPL